MRDSTELVLLTGAADETGEDAIEKAAPDPVRSANVAPTDRVRVLLRDEGRLVLRRHVWGLIPLWSRDTRGAARMINARVESVATKPAYRRSVRSARCLVPADGWYEWQQTDERRIPHFVQRADGQPIWFAGIWARWRLPGDAEPTDSVAVITGPSPSVLAWLHDRAPVVVPEGFTSRWLGSGDTPLAANADVQPLLDTLMSAGSPPLSWHQVSREIGQVRVKDARLMAPVAAPVTAKPEAVPLELF
jgi:putative SOS response-associated peptidase YedK